MACASRYQIGQRRRLNQCAICGSCVSGHERHRRRWRAPGFARNAACARIRLNTSLCQIGASNHVRRARAYLCCSWRLVQPASLPCRPCQRHWSAKVRIGSRAQARRQRRHDQEDVREPHKLVCVCVLLGHMLMVSQRLLRACTCRVPRAETATASVARPPCTATAVHTHHKMSV